MEEDEEAIILHIGCGMDSRIHRVGTNGHTWFDVDFPDVIRERKLYYQEDESYHMIESDARENAWIPALPESKNAIIVMEGVTMYFKPEELKQLLKDLTNHFNQVSILMDCYTNFAAKASKYKNPINEVGVTEVYGVDDPRTLEEGTGLSYVKEHNMTPDELVDELTGFEKAIYKKVFAGSFSKKMYRMYEYKG
jgi:O-methyltransferase involved in polyketide biosynthesis